MLPKRNAKGRFVASAEPKPKPKIAEAKKPKAKANPHIIKKGDKEYITKVDEEFEPCKSCRWGLRENCQRYLDGDLKIEYYRKNENCIVEGDTARFDE